ncbi:fimbrial protein [Proteus mirabilis]|uniref:fimbrial protein n=1 Tax=Proteus mirabilis TaxID=584 RepID=UPI0039B5030E
MKYFFALLFFLSNTALAVPCVNSRDPSQSVSFDLSTVFSSGQNKPNTNIDLTKSFRYNVYAICPANRSDYSWRTYRSPLPIVQIDNNFKFLEINDYIYGAMQITDSYAGRFYPPSDYVQMGKHPNIKKQREFPVRDTNYLFRLKIVKPFIDSIPIESKTMFYVYVNTEPNEALGEVVYTISYSGSFSAPQSCEFNAGDIIEINFGKIGAQLFKEAGIGNKPNNVNAVTKNFTINCKNIDAQAYLKLRIEAAEASDNIILSDNPDIGFKVSDNNGNILTPNDINSNFPFQLNENASANLAIKAWPVSTTGQLPKEGVFSARTYLRVDFD